MKSILKINKIKVTHGFTGQRRVLSRRQAIRSPVNKFILIKWGALLPNCTAVQSTLKLHTVTKTHKPESLRKLYVVLPEISL